MKAFYNYADKEIYLINETDEIKEGNLLSDIIKIPNVYQHQDKEYKYIENELLVKRNIASYISIQSIKEIPRLLNK